MEAVNRKFQLAARPVGLPKPSDWEHTSTPVPEPGESEVLVKVEREWTRPTGARRWVQTLIVFLADWLPLVTLLAAAAVTDAIDGVMKRPAALRTLAYASLFCFAYASST